MPCVDFLYIYLIIYGKTETKLKTNISIPTTIVNVLTSSTY